MMAQTEAKRSPLTTLCYLERGRSVSDAAPHFQEE